MRVSLERLILLIRCKMLILLSEPYFIGFGVGTLRRQSSSLFPGACSLVLQVTGMGHHGRETSHRVTRVTSGMRRDVQFNSVAAHIKIQRKRVSIYMVFTTTL